MKKYILNLVPFIIGAVCFASYSVIGSKVAEDGTLVEPFFLIPVGYLFILVGIVGLLFRGGVNYFRKLKESR